MSRNTPDRKKIMQPSRPKFGSTHLGQKTKEVLAQELFSLNNRIGQSMSVTEMRVFNAAYEIVKNDWISQFGLEDWLEFWLRTFKGKK